MSETARQMEEVNSTDATRSKKKKPEREFHFSNYPSRKIAVRLAYHGHLYDGLAKQEETSNTVEAFVITALRRVRLVASDGPKDLARCGRTDKGVSALGNAFSFTARASSASGDDPPNAPLDYCGMLNSALPPSIRIIGWAYVDDKFDARFSCVGRTYRYFFCHRGLDMRAMQLAAVQLIGTHSFRNFCKMDVVNVSNFERHVYSASLVPSELLPEMISCLEIRANSFLYHQIRCTMAVLLLVGRGLESPSVVTDLLQRGDRKPVYPLADSTPLVLWDCHFANLEWNISPRALVAAEQELRDIATALLLRAAAADSMRTQLLAWYGNAKEEKDAADDWSATGSDWTDARTHANLRVRKYDLYTMAKQVESGDASVGGRPYIKLLNRETERTFEEEVQSLSGKKRARFEANMEKKNVVTTRKEEV